MLEKTRRKALFLDRDGVVNRVLLDERGKPTSPHSLAELELMPGVKDLADSARRRGFLVIVFTNQPDLARRRITREMLDLIHARIQAEVPLDDLVLCPHDDADACACRKPKPGLLHDAAERWGIDLSRSLVVGDQWKDISAGKAAGCRTILLKTDYAQRLEEPHQEVGTLAEVEPLLGDPA